MSEKSIESKRIAITVPEPIYDKIERRRGIVKRSTYIREIIKSWWKEGHTLEDLKESNKNGKRQSY